MSMVKILHILIALVMNTFERKERFSLAIKMSSQISSEYRFMSG